MSIKDTVARALRGGKAATDTAPAREPAPDALTLIKNDHHEGGVALQDGARRRREGGRET